ncbi:GH92 family glycosyl hydrolase [Galbibacter mesophilus]|uniref:GH92 family glycosyl hydrolase n=2 Tax=Galbibacter mesophilus TaxID=379069 RepID=UPI002044B5A0|nr:GH92 family glycosyl hydrolase [Galbibacter mesophilus]MCM5664050.1 GH92 family glycosyl hydrolase [Galbibacter mesophilus]
MISRTLNFNIYAVIQSEGKNMSTFMFPLIWALMFVALPLKAQLSKETLENAAERCIVTNDPVSLVYPFLDTEHSRWFYFSSASRPFGMVNLSPDTATDGAWNSGYRYQIDTIQGFSHVHAWQLSALSVMPVQVSKNNETNIFTDYYSQFSHEKEIASPGFHSVYLERYGVHTDLTSTKRVGFHRYRFPNGTVPTVLFNLNKQLGPCKNMAGRLQQSGDKSLSGELTMSATSRRPKPIKVYFQIDFNVEIDSLHRDKTTGNYLAFTKKESQETLMKVGISYTSLDNARTNISKELPGWDFEAAVCQSLQDWNKMLSRIKVFGNSKTHQRRFYTDLWHALQGRRIISDANGAYPDYTGTAFRIGQIPLDKFGTPTFNHYNSDAFWGAQWTIQTLWGLVYPSIMKNFSLSLLQYQKDGGLVPRGPSGGNYTNVMTGASSTPFIVGAVQREILKENLDQVYTALKKNHVMNGMMSKAGYEHNTAIGGGLEYYLEKGYVPYPLPEKVKAHHKNGASMTLEYSYQDWALAQFAKKLNLQKDYRIYKKRSENWKNVFDASVGWIRPKNRDGVWKKEYDLYQIGHGFTEANGAQNTWFVPHDLPELAKLMGGNEKASEKLNEQFKTAEKSGFTAGDSHGQEKNPKYSRIPVNYGNEPSMQTAFIFNHLGRPDLTQYWSRKVIDSVFSGLSPETGYSGDEDQGILGSLAVLMKIGLFQMNGGVESNPKYEFGSPIFDKIVITLENNKKLIIKALGSASGKKYIETVKWNGKPLQSDSEQKHIQHKEIIQGGTLEFIMKSSNPVK